MRQRKSYRKNRRGKKREEVFHIFMIIKFIQEKDHKQELGQFLEFWRIYYKTFDTLLDFNDQKEI